MTTSPVPALPDSAPFTPEQRAWLNGFLAGLFSRQPAPAESAAAPAAATPRPLTILWGSQTGTAEALARQAAKLAGARGFATTILDMAQCDVARLTTEQNVLVITSTYGDGEPPDNARTLHDALAAAASPALPAELRFAVCALGDSSYTLFCHCGRAFDQALEKCGARRVHPRLECDGDPEAAFTGWLEAALAAFAPASAEAVPPLSADRLEPPAPPAPGHSKSHPFPAPVVAVRRLSGAGSAKEVNHVELSLADSGLVYEAGDALGVWPQNCPELVEEVLAALDCDGEEAVPTQAGELPLRTALLQHFDLGKPTDALLRLCAPDAARESAHAIDLLLAARVRPGPAAFAGALRKLAPRLYSISSSPKAHPDQVHLTVGAVRYEAHGRRRKGACSTFLAERALGLGHARVFVHANPAFRPPMDPARPMIMIGPGTGIAPFRAFLQERRAVGATGRHWLFFGDQREASDFLYRDELLAMQRDGTLSRLDLAWSRDQGEKIYVQHRMLEHAAELWRWLEEGAHLYVCGDAARMAKDVDAALHQVIATAGERSADQAAAYVQSLRAAKRYARDVY